MGRESICRDPAALSVSFIGAGRVAKALGIALARKGVKIRNVASRSESSARQLVGVLAGSRFTTIDEATAETDVIFVTVPDDAIAEVVSSHRNWREGVLAVHCSGSWDLSVLEHARSNGASVGGFHPLQTFANPDLAASSLEGSSVGLEGDHDVCHVLESLAVMLGMRVLRVPTWARPRYHAAANYAASFLVSALKEALDLWKTFGVEQDEALQALLPMSFATLQAVRQGGLIGALSGPFSRGDLRVVRSHIESLSMLGSDHVVFYQVIAERQLAIARERGLAMEEQLFGMHEVLRSGKSASGHTGEVHAQG